MLSSLLQSSVKRRKQSTAGIEEEDASPVVAAPVVVAKPRSVAEIRAPAATAVAVDSNGVLPLTHPGRAVDYWFVVWYAIFWFTVM